MAKYLISYNVVMALDTEEDDIDLTDSHDVACWMGNQMHDWLDQGGNPYPDNIKVEEFEL